VVEAVEVVTIVEGNAKRLRASAAVFSSHDAQLRRACLHFDHVDYLDHLVDFS
jgi:hypothetical protein